MNKIYGITKGASISKANAQIYGKELEKINEDFGSITPEQVVEKARNKSNPMHKYFDWNNNTASEKYRLWQARCLINHITIVIKYDGNIKEQKAFFSVNSEINDEETEKVYVTMEKALSEKDLRRQVLQKALDEIIYWKMKYNQYKELSEIFKAINKTKRRVIK